MDTKNLARAHANIALIKYWGKKDETLMLPCNSSISLTLADLYTETVVFIQPELSTDVFYLNDEKQDEKEVLKAVKIVNLFRKDPTQYVEIRSINNMPTAAGVSSSSSGIAALVLACNKTFNTNLTDAELSRYARYGSGSACRSIYPGFVRWEATDDDQTSIAYPIKSNLDLSMIILLLTTGKKSVLSRAGMKNCVDTSVYYPAWVESTQQDYQEMLLAIEQDDFFKIGELTERSTLKMHATTLAANPPFSYLNAKTYQAIDIVKSIKAKYPCFYTMDAGPNVKVLCQTKDLQNIKQELLQHYNADQIMTSGVL